MSLTTDNQQAFPILERIADNRGVPIHEAIEGETITGKSAAAALVAKDNAGNFKYLEINTDGELKVNTESVDIACLSGTAKVTGGTSEQTVLDITLQQNTEYRDIAWIVSNFRQTEFRIVTIDDEGVGDNETELATLLVGPGDYTDSNSGMKCLSFTSGGTGNQVLRLYGTNRDVASDLRGTLSVAEVQ